MAVIIWEIKYPIFTTLSIIVSYSKNSYNVPYRPPKPVTGIALLYRDRVRFL
jgi:hypothetical protein